MNENDRKKNQDRLDQATAARLAKLASRPVDMSQLNRQLEQTLDENKIQPPATFTWPWRQEGTHEERQARAHVWSQKWTRVWRPITTAAAAILVLATMGWFLLDGGPAPILASPIDLAQIHFEVANELSPHLKVSTVAEANERLANQSERIMPLPQLPNELKSCCLHQYDDTILTCALIEREGQRITIAIAAGEKFHSPKGTTINRQKRQFVAHSVNGINMVMTHQADRWLCVMGQDIAIDTLVDVAIEIDLK